MKIIYDLKDFSAVKPVVSIGTFDGIHLGHQKVLLSLKQTALEIKGESVVFTFLQHPRSVLFPNDSSLKLLTSFAEKVELIKEIGIDILIAFPFTVAFSQLKSEDFIKQFLINKIKMHTLVVGYDHQFGKNREGAGVKHEVLSKQFGYSFYTMKPFKVNKENVSSTKIRNSLLKGDIQTANAFLGRCYSLSGKVVEGQKLGRQIGFPTANILIEDKTKLLPLNGVYAVQIESDNKLYNGMLNIGANPTVNSEITQDLSRFVGSIEVNIFDFTHNIYNKNIKVLFYERMRSEQKFDSLEKLKQQLFLDQLNAKSILPKI